jgi:hypothetical protein
MATTSRQCTELRDRLASESLGEDDSPSRLGVGVTVGHVIRPPSHSAPLASPVVEIGGIHQTAPTSLLDQRPFPKRTFRGPPCPGASVVGSTVPAPPTLRRE